MLGRVFKAYDIRGVYPDPLTDQMAWQIGYGCAKFLLRRRRGRARRRP
jgi:phosphomannomutase